MNDKTIVPKVKASVVSGSISSFVLVFAAAIQSGDVSTVVATFFISALPVLVSFVAAYRKIDENMVKLKVILAEMESKK